MNAKGFCCVLRLGFFYFYVEFGVSFISYFKREMVMLVKDQMLECKCLETWNLLFFLIWSSILILNNYMFYRCSLNYSKQKYILTPGKFSDRQELGLFMKNDFLFWKKLKSIPCRPEIIKSFSVRLNLMLSMSLWKF